MNKRPYLITSLSIFVAFLVGLISDLVSDDLGLWLEPILGKNYVLILVLVAVLFLIISIWLTVKGNSDDAKQGNVKNVLDNQDLQPTIELANQILSTENYTALRKLLQESRLKEAAKQMNHITFLSADGDLFLGRITAYERDKKAGVYSLEQVSLFENSIRQEMLNLINRHQPPSEEKETKTTSSGELLIPEECLFLITTSDSRVLRAERKIVGRGNSLKDLKKQLLVNKTPGLIIKGEAGLGKTAICKKLLGDLASEAAFSQLYWIDVEKLPNVAFLQSVLCQMVDIPLESKWPQLRRQLSEKQSTCIYLDNLETLLEDQAAIAFLEKLIRIDGIQWLASSREEENILGWEVFKLDELKKGPAQQLFRSEWKASGGANLPRKLSEPTATFIEKDLGAHPLSIVLTASHANAYPHLSDLIAAFKEEATRFEQKYGTLNQRRLSNLDYSLGLSLRKVEDQPSCLRLWVLLAFFPNGIDARLQAYLIQENYFSIKDKTLLLQKSIIREDQGLLTALPPILRFAKALLFLKDTSFQPQQLLADAIKLGDISNTRSVLDWRNRIPFLIQVLTVFVPHVPNYPETRHIDNLLFNDYLKFPQLSKSVLEQMTTLVSVEEQPAWIADVLLNLGGLYFLLGENDLARQSYERAQVFYEKTGSEQGQGNVARNLGELYFRLGENDLARQSYERAQVFYEKTGSEQGQGNVACNLGGLYFRLGENDLARQSYERAQVFYEKTGSELGKANALHFLAVLEKNSNKAELAYRYWSDSLLIYQKIGMFKDVAETEIYLAQLDIQAKKLNKAKQRLERAQEVAEQLESSFLKKLINQTKKDLK